MNSVPYVIEKNGKNGERAYDLYSRLLKDRIIFVSGSIDTNMANSVVAQLLFLDASDSSRNIHIYINSGGGLVSAGLSILDVMSYVKSEVVTTCYGTAASMASLLLCCGQKKKRFILPNGTVMIHQPLGGFQGDVSSIKIHYDHIESLQKRLYNIYCNVTGKSFDEIKEACDRDNFMSAEEAIEFGLVDEILTTSKKDTKLDKK